MTWLLGASVVALALIAFWQHRRISQLESVLPLMGALMSPEAHRRQHKIWELENAMHYMVLRARAAGDLDKANKMMELQRWADVNYDASWLDGMFRGFP